MKFVNGKSDSRIKTGAGLIDWLPPELLLAIRNVSKRLEAELFLVGGTVRDWLLDAPPHDLDLTVASGAVVFCRELVKELNSGALVMLGTDEDEAARVVWRGLDIDISAYRRGSKTLDEDLRLRDFTINAMAVSLSHLNAEGAELKIIDPLGGMSDLKKGVVHHCPNSFEDDPLRLVRAFRFMAALECTIHQETMAAIRAHASTITHVAVERVTYEFDYIMASNVAAQTLGSMHDCGLLQPILPELYEGLGVEQPTFHHLDVFYHNLQALTEIEMVMEKPERFFHQTEEIVQALSEPRAAIRLKWAALLHDVAKPMAKGESTSDPGRVTFYNHDQLGGKLVERIGRRLKWSNEDREEVSRLVVMHMHPFHLCNVRREGELSVRAALKLSKRAGGLLDSLFLLAMADSLAGQGELKPEDMEKELAELYGEILTIQREKIGPVLGGPPLMNGNDLIEHFALRPGPIFSEILDELQALQAEGAIGDRQSALSWVESYLKEREKPQERGH